MSQYYKPHQPPRGRQTEPQPSSSAQTNHRPFYLSRPEDSIYIFPNPPSSTGSAPPSPLASLGSDISVPTDLTFSHLSKSRSQSRHSSSNRADENGDIGRHFSPGGVDGDPEVEIWDWNAESMISDVSPSEDLEESVSAGELEQEIDRAHRWELLSYPAHQRAEVVRPSSLWLARQRRLDSEILLSSHTSQDTLSSDLVCSGVGNEKTPVIAQPVPQHRKRMLSFFASCLFVDESTLNLLAHPLPSSESILFPGHAPLYSSDSGSEGGTCPPPKVLARGTETGILKDGLRLACDPDYMPFSPFSLPSVRLSGLLGLVHGVWTNGGRAWRGVWA